MSVDPEATGPATMKALRAHGPGGPEQLVYEDAPRPVPGAGEVSVRVGAAAITFDELAWHETWEPAVIPAHEFAGVVADVGRDVRDLKAGDAVFGLVPFDRDGAAAEYVVVPETHCVRKPPGVPDEVAAAAVLPALTAWEALAEHVGLAAGQRLLVYGGSGGVGAMLVQLAHRQGLRVAATVRSPGSVARVERLGADEVVVSGDGVPQHLEPADAAIDAVGAGTPAWVYRAVRPGGRLITLQEPPDERLATEQGIDAAFFVVTPRKDRLEELAALLSEGDIDVAVARTFPLSDGREAYGTRGGAGKTVLLPG